MALRVTPKRWVCGCLLWVMWVTTVAEIPPGIIPTEDYPHTAAILPDGQYFIFWKYDSEDITLEIHVKAKGYVGLGLSPKGGMQGADIIFGWVKDGQTYFYDCYAERNAAPKVDPSQDWKLLEGKETDSHTMLKFTRKLTNCDEHDLDIETETTRLIWAYHDRDPDNIDSIFYHGNTQRGSRSIQLATLTHLNPPLPDDKEAVEFFNRNQLIPEQETTWWCRGFSVPQFSSTNYAVMVEPYITLGNEALVHHMIVYACYHDPEVGSWDDWDGVEAQCYHGIMPSDQCNTMVFSWAVGGDNFYYPEGVGYPINSQGVRFYRLETHYDNPGGVSGRYDSSGLRVWVTPTRQTNEAAILTLGLGVGDGQIIPPNYPDFINIGHCEPECLQEAMAVSGVDELHVFAGLLHTHLAGTQVVIRHFRNGTELPPIQADPYFDFNYQEARRLRQEIIIKKGDRLVVQCNYDTKYRSAYTVGGFATSEEMCMALMYYYPPLSLGDCTSLPHWHDYYQGLGKQLTAEQEEQSPWVIRYQVLDLIKEADWRNEELRSDFQTAVTSRRYQVACTGGKTRYPINEAIVDTMEGLEVWKKPEKCTIKVEPGSGAENLSCMSLLIIFLLLVCRIIIK